MVFNNVPFNLLHFQGLMYYKFLNLNMCVPHTEPFNQNISVLIVIF